MGFGIAHENIHDSGNDNRDILDELALSYLN
jgi:hypothetical protein